MLYLTTLWDFSIILGLWKQFSEYGHTTKSQICFFLSPNKFLQKAAVYVIEELCLSMSYIGTYPVYVSVVEKFYYCYHFCPFWCSSESLLPSWKISNMQLILFFCYWGLELQFIVILFLGDIFCLFIKLHSELSLVNSLCLFVLIAYF